VTEPVPPHPPPDDWRPYEPGEPIDMRPDERLWHEADYVDPVSDAPPSA